MEKTNLKFSKPLLVKKHNVFSIATSWGFFILGDKMRICKVDGCNKSRKITKGYCIKHYTQMLRYGKILDRTIYSPNEIIIKGDIAEIILYNRHGEETARTIIDTGEVEKIKPYKWHTAKGYVETTVRGGKNILLQNMIMNITSSRKRMVDHKDRDTLNNRKVNFRICTNKENSRNSKMPSHNTSGAKGVYWRKERNKWQAQIKINQKQTYIGIFKDKTKAILAYNEAAYKHFGEFAYQNKI